MVNTMMKHLVALGRRVPGSSPGHMEGVLVVREDPRTP